MKKQMVLYSKMADDRKEKRESILHLNLNVRPKTAKRLRKALEFSRDEETFA